MSQVRSIKDAYSVIYQTAYHAVWMEDHNDVVDCVVHGLVALDRDPIHKRIASYKYWSLDRNNIPDDIDEIPISMYINIFYVEQIDGREVETMSEIRIDGPRKYHSDYAQDLSKVAKCLRLHSL